MKKLVTFLFVLTLLAASSFAQDKDVSAGSVPTEYVSDGCSLFPDGNYCKCCVEHDEDYYNGGNWKQRLRSDNRLYKCVSKTKGLQNKFIAPVMWMGVRVFGVSFLPTPFRWGFGKKLKKGDLNRKDAETVKNVPIRR